MNKIYVMVQDER